jgi:UDP-glucose 4-epimerase
MKVLVTGGLGFIGSHTSVELIKQGYEVIIVDSLVNSSEDTLDKIEEITGIKPKLSKYDLTDLEKTNEIFDENDIDAVVHFAGLKAVGESVRIPLDYYSNNLESTINLLKAMKSHDVKKIIFSSSATVYGDPGTPKYHEGLGRGIPTSPYGATKAMIEEILEDLYKSDNEWSVVILRYFNPVGAHESGLIGESPNGIPNNLMPFIMQVASGKRECLNIFGNDYPTRDGTCIRDFIHVVDLAEGHVKALEKIEKDGKGLYVYNLGRGNGVSVLEMVQAFEKVNNIKLNYKFAERREGDLPEYYADPSKANKELGWFAKRTIEDMCRDSWNFEKNN